MKPTVVITAAGNGSRFKAQGFREHKPAILWRSRPLLWWSLIGVAETLRQADVWVVTQRAHRLKGLLSEVFATLDLDDPTHVFVDKVTGGQADTVRVALDAGAPAQSPLIIWNVDTFIRPGTSFPTSGNWLHVFPSDSPSMSYARFEGGRAVEVAEKVVISHWASSGLYGFESGETFETARRSLSSDTAQVESYVAPLYAGIINSGGLVTGVFAEPGEVVPLGTPEDLDRAPAGLTPDELLADRAKARNASTSSSPEAPWW